MPGSPCLSEKGESNVQFVPFLIFFYLGGYLLWMDQRIPGPVSCRCPSGSLETPPRWHATISCINYNYRVVICDVTCHKGTLTFLLRFINEARPLPILLDILFIYVIPFSKYMWYFENLKNKIRPSLNGKLKPNWALMITNPENVKIFTIRHLHRVK